MSYSFNEPEWPPVCECHYDEARDEVFRGNCPLHYQEQQEAPVPAERKPPAIAKFEPPSALRARRGSGRRQHTQ